MRALSAFVNIEKIKRAHLMGIGGAGMSGLAQLLKEMNIEVSGCDNVNSFYAEKISRQGVPIESGHHRDHLLKYNPDLLIFSSAISQNNPEIQAAYDKGILVAKRAEVLSGIFNARRGVGVAGTHGKTTTSSMISLMAELAGCAATVAIGGELSDIGCNAKLGLGEYMIAELDESDGSFELFSPSIAIITNIDWDHIDHYPSLTSVFDAFARFAAFRKKGAPLIACAEDLGVSHLISSGKLQDVCTYGWGTGWDWGATEIRPIPGGGVTYLLHHQGVLKGEIKLRVSGEHNVLNSLAACAAAHFMGISFHDYQEALGRFNGAKRRLQHLGNFRGVDIYDDYGHHPNEIAATLAALEGIYPHRPKLVIFQPHRYSRTGALYKEFASALCSADKIYLLPIYAADETPPPGVSSALIAKAAEDMGHTSCQLCDNFQDSIQKLYDSIHEGDLVLTIGAGDVGTLGKNIMEGMDTYFSDEQAFIPRR